jgi:hypothetical protein
MIRRERTVTFGINDSAYGISYVKFPSFESLTSMPRRVNRERRGKKGAASDGGKLVVSSVGTVYDA